MKLSVDNYTLRDALFTYGFQDITSKNRSTKSWRLRHPRMQHWVSIKLAQAVERPMATAPLVIHPDDAQRIKAAIRIDAGVTFESRPYKSSSTNYGETPGVALSLASLAAIDEFVAALKLTAREASSSAASSAHSEHAQPAPDQVEIDPVLLAAVASELDAEYAGKRLGATTRQRLIEARLGQGQFRDDMLKIWGARCAVTGCRVVRALVASHAVAWRDDSTPEVRLDPFNGLLLTASIDRLFDQGLIGFADDGSILRKPELSPADLALLGLQEDSRLRQVHPRNLPYLAAHRARHGF